MLMPDWNLSDRWAAGVVGGVVRTVDVPALDDGDATTEVDGGTELDDVEDEGLAA
jgi:hypothetical protein